MGRRRERESGGGGGEVEKEGSMGLMTGCEKKHRAKWQQHAAPAVGGACPASAALCSCPSTCWAALFAGTRCLQGKSLAP